MKLYAWRGIYFRRDIIEYQGNTIDYHQQLSVLSFWSRVTWFTIGDLNIHIGNNSNEFCYYKVMDNLIWMELQLHILKYTWFFV